MEKAEDDAERGWTDLESYNITDADFVVGIASSGEQFYGCLLGNFSTELSAQSPMIREQLEHAFQQWRTVLAKAIALAQQDGSVPSGDPAEELADVAINTWQGAVARSKAAQSRAPLDLFLKTLMHKLLK